VGIDVNERNVTWSDSSGRTVTEDISEVAELKERYWAIRAKLPERTQSDRRTQRRLLSKYGRREKDRAIQVIHRVTKGIVERAGADGFGIVMEKLKGIRRLYRKGNGQGKSYRGRMNSWMFREFQRQVQYKAAWVGLPVAYVNPRGTSRKCPDCGSSLTTVGGRKLLRPPCKKTRIGTLSPPRT